MRQMHKIFPSLLIVIVLIFSFNCTAQPFDVSVLDEKDHLCMDDPITITDSFQVLSIKQVRKNNLDESVELLLKHNHSYEKYIKQIKKYKCYVIHVKRDNDIFVVVSQSSKNKANTERIVIGQTYVLTLSPYYGRNFYPKYGMCVSIDIDSIKYLFDSGIWWFQNLYTSHNLNGCKIRH